MRVISFGGISNDGADYLMWLEQPFSQPGLKTEVTPRTGRDPVVSAAVREAKVINLHVRIGVNDWGAIYTETTRAPLREALFAALDTETAAAALVVADDDGDNERYVYAVARKVDEQPGSEGMGEHVVATLVTHEETRWRANTAHEETWAVAASGETRADLDFLKQQMDLLDMLGKHNISLDVLNGVQLGVSADPGQLMDLMVDVLNRIVLKTSYQLGSMSTVPSVTAPTPGTRGAATYNVNEQTINGGQHNYFYGREESELEELLVQSR